MSIRFSKVTLNAGADEWSFHISGHPLTPGELTKYNQYKNFCYLHREFERITITVEKYLFGDDGVPNDADKNHMRMIGVFNDFGDDWRDGFAEQMFTACAGEERWYIENPEAKFEHQKRNVGGVLMETIEVALWLDQRIYNAMQRALLLESISVEAKMQGVLERVAEEVIGPAYADISAEIAAERLADERARENERKFTVFHYRKGGDECFFNVGQEIDLLYVAYRLRAYLKCQEKTEPFFVMFNLSENISSERFGEFVQQYTQGSDKVCGVYDINLDADVFSAMGRSGDWNTFSAKKLSAAAYHANRKSGVPRERQLEKLMEHLNQGAENQYTMEE